LAEFSLQELADKLSLSYQGNPNHVVTGVLPLLAASSSDLSFCRSEKQAKLLAQTQAGVVIITPVMAEEHPGNALLADDPQQALIGALELLHPKARPQPGVHASAVVHESVQVPVSATIGAQATVAAGVRLGERVVIEAGCSIGEQTVLGDDVYLAPNVVLYDHVSIGDRVSVHAGTVIGSDGFGYHRLGYTGPWQKVPQVGGVTIEDDVEIGASTTIDRGALTDTHIARGAKIDNQCMIAHNVYIGEDTAIAACSGVAGSTRIGNNCILAGHCGVADNLTITDQVILLGKAAVSNSIKEPGMYGSGTGLLPRSVWFRLVARLRNLDKTIKTINQKIGDKNDK
jgi:UDP-3-O-[3-hydroxymyristoyl] glucosamine N-acyltransferase